jgi:ferredoxin-type protein NapG
VLEVAAIKVYPIKLAKGEIGQHYQLGWDEKRKAGKSLVEDKGLVDLPARMPDGMRLPGHSDPGGGQPNYQPAEGPR